MRDYYNGEKIVEEPKRSANISLKSIESLLSLQDSL